MRILGFKIMLLLLSACGSSQESESIYPANVGDIAFDPQLDDPEFRICHSPIFQYYNNGMGLEFEGEKAAINDYYASEYSSPESPGADGYITIRFVVNCEGTTDRFRIFEMDRNYQEKEFPAEIAQSILNLTKKLKGWKIKKYQDTAIDYYQYLTFKIEDGQIIEIMP